MNNNSSGFGDVSSSLRTFDTREKVIYTTGLVLLSILTLLGNGLVVIAFYTYRPLRTYTNYFIISLSASDILVGLISIPIWVAIILTDNDRSLLGGKVCNLKLF
jgi:7 transmembrane receptor (rhodopsin family).